MEIEINITKIKFFVILAALFVIGGFVFVYAFNSPMYKTTPDSGASYKDATQAVTFGHSADEAVVRFYDGSLDTVQNILAGNGKPLKIYQCSLSDTELKNNGCPQGTQLYKIVRACTGSGPSCTGSDGSAYCRWKVYTDTVQGSTPTCYVAGGGGGGGASDPVCGDCDSSNYGDVCCVKGLICAVNSDGNRGWMPPPSGLDLVCQ